MSFQYAKNDPRGKPVLKKLDGEWVFFYKYGANMDLVQQAEAWCEKMNSPFRSLYK